MLQDINVLTKLHLVLDQEAHIAIYMNFILANFNCTSLELLWNSMFLKDGQKSRFIYKNLVSTYQEWLAKGDHTMLYIGRL